MCGCELKHHGIKLVESGAQAFLWPAWCKSAIRFMKHLTTLRHETAFPQVLQRGIPFMVILGEEEVKQGVVKIKDMEKRTEEVTLAMESIIACPAFFFCLDKARLLEV